MARTRSRRTTAVALCALVVLAGCSGDDGGATPEPTTTQAPTTGQGATPTTAPAAEVGPAPEGAEPLPTAREAVEALLQAEVRSHHEASYALLSTAGRAAHPRLADWVGRRAEVATLVGFEVEEATGASVVVRADNEPGLDPFRGLSAAHERQTWTATPVTGGGWLVDPEPAVELLLPPDAEAAEAATAWVEAVQACDEVEGRSLQALDQLHGTSTRATQLCGATGAVQVGAPGPLAPGPTATELVQQYSADVDLWARAVPVVAPIRFTVVLAPLGDTWQVLALSD